MDASIAVHVTLHIVVLGVGYVFFVVWIVGGNQLAEVDVPERLTLSIIVMVGATLRRNVWLSAGILRSVDVRLLMLLWLLIVRVPVAVAVSMAAAFPCCWPVGTIIHIHIHSALQSAQIVDLLHELLVLALQGLIHVPKALGFHLRGHRYVCIKDIYLQSE